MITAEAVEQACNDVADFSEEQMASEFERFFRTQPELCDFVVELTGESEPRIQELALFLSYMVFKAVETGGTTGPAITHSAIENAFKASEIWIERLNGLASGDLESSMVSSFEADAEPHLLHYILSEINDTTGQDSPLTDEEKGEVFFVLKTVITSLSSVGGPF